jgi:hypothetical protein
VKLGGGIRHSPQSEISLVYKLLKNHTPRREIAIVLFVLKLGVFRPCITMPYDPHRR